MTEGPGGAGRTVIWTEGDYQASEGMIHPGEWQTPDRVPEWGVLVFHRDAVMGAFYGGDARRNADRWRDRVLKGEEP